MMQEGIFIFDLDGTLANAEHRVHLIQNHPKQWDEFYNQSKFDAPIVETIYTLQALYRAGNNIWIWTGRSSQVRDITEEWLMKNSISYDQLLMRQETDHRPDFKVKQECLSKIPKEDFKRLIGVFEDRNQVVNMWRQFGIQCFQVNEGNF